MALQVALRVLVVAAALCGFCRPAVAAPPATVILLSIDGFRADYLDRGLTPTLDALAETGVRAALRPAFPTVTFPNHYTLVTGLYPDHHGIVGNVMVDDRIKNPAHCLFKLSDREAMSDPDWWQQGIPLWVTLQRQGVRSAAMFWPGSDFPIFGLQPDHWVTYDGKMSYADRVDRLLSWLDLPIGQRPRFLTLYLDHVDEQGHRAGPASAAVDGAIAEADAAIARLSAGLQRRGLSDQVDLVIVADHGMAAVSPDRVLYIDDMAPASFYQVINSGAVMGIKPAPEHRAEVEAALLAPHPHLHCWRKQEIPPRLHFGSNDRIPPLVCLAEAGWLVVTRDDWAKSKGPSGGSHGYDNQAAEMTALFVAHGPDFKIHHRQPIFDNVDVYPLLTHLLKVRGEVNDGDVSAVRGLLR